MAGECPAAAQVPQQNHPLRGALIKYFIATLLLFSILRFVSGRADWYRAWFYAGLMLAAQLAVGLALARKNPALLEERSRMREGTKRWDKWLAPIVALAGPMSMWVVAALDVRTNWPPGVPVWGSEAALFVCVPGVLLTAWAMLSNRFFAATVRIQKERGHVVVDSGPYRLVRHPGYTGALVFTLASPIALGSWLALIPSVLTAAVLVLRTALEDRTLQAELPGYREYTSHVRSRLIPGLW